tara:strand:+ start:815 stop:1561 length:747 start_codon:yes stop_codon:yes gene_type:complete
MKMNCALILTCTIDPRGIRFLVRNNINDRLNDYKESFDFYFNNEKIKKIIIIENSGYSVNFIKSLKNFKNKDKNIEIISTKINNYYDRSLGKGYGEYLNLKTIFHRSKIAKKTKFFIHVSGRYKILNFSRIVSEIESKNPEIYLNLKDNLRYGDTTIYAGTKKFFLNYLIPNAKKTNDFKKNYFEHCASRAALISIADGMKFINPSIYPIVNGFIGTNGKKFNYNFIKKIKLFFFSKIKSYILSNIRY